VHAQIVNIASLPVLREVCEVHEADGRKKSVASFKEVRKSLEKLV